MRVAFLQDLTVPSHVDLVSPSFLAFDLGVHNAVDASGTDIDIEVVQMDTEGDRERATAFAEEIAADPSYVAAVAAPFWSEPPEVASILAEASMPTLSLSPQSPAPPPSPQRGALATTGLWRRFVPDDSLQVDTLVTAIEHVLESTSDAQAGTEPLCIFGEEWSYSIDLQRDLEQALPPSIVQNDPSPGDIDAAVADVDQGCSLVVWTGAPEGALDLASALHDAHVVRGRAVDFGADALKTVIPPTAPNHEGVVVGVLTCPCADVSTRRDEDVRRFVNAYQSANGLAPGIYAAEAWDAAHVLAGFLTNGARDRSAIAAELGELEQRNGVARDYVFDQRGELREARVGMYVAAGTRWLPFAG